MQADSALLCWDSVNDLCVTLLFLRGNFWTLGEPVEPQANCWAPGLCTEDSPPTKEGTGSPGPGGRAHSTLLPTGSVPGPFSQRGQPCPNRSPRGRFGGRGGPRRSPADAANPLQKPGPSRGPGKGLPRGLVEPARCCGRHGGPATARRCWTLSPRVWVGLLGRGHAVLPDQSMCVGPRLGFTTGKRPLQTPSGV